MTSMSDSTTFPGFYRLFSGRALLTLPAYLVGVFMPIFLYELFNRSEVAPFLFYTVGYSLYLLLLPFGARTLNKRGYRLSIAMSTVWNTLYYAALAALGLGLFAGDYIWLGLGASVLAIVLFRLHYWLPYHVEVASLTRKQNRGRAVSLILSMITVAGVFGPFLGGVIIEQLGFPIAFMVVAGASLLAAIPFSLLPKQHEHYDWTYAQTWRKLVSKKYRPLTLAMVANGAENVVGIVVWPLFIYLLLNADYLAVGAVSSLIVGATIALQMMAGQHLDAARGRGNMLRVGSVLAALGWITKIFVVSAFQIFVAGLYHNFARIFTKTPVDTIYYDIAADSGHYIDELTVLREMAIQIGRILALMGALLLSLLVAVQWTFALAAVAALILNALYAQHEVHRV